MRYFTKAEFACKCGCSRNEISPTFLYRLDELRHRCGFPFVITSGYRCKDHPAERNKPGGPGQHNKGVAADIAVSGGAERYKIVKHATRMGFHGIGPNKDFIHVDDRAGSGVLWIY